MGGKTETPAHTRPWPRTNSFSARRTAKRRGQGAACAKKGVEGVWGRGPAATLRARAGAHTYINPQKSQKLQNYISVNYLKAISGNGPIGLLTTGILPLRPSIHFSIRRALTPGRAG